MRYGKKIIVSIVGEVLNFSCFFNFIYLQIYSSIKIVFHISGAVDIELYQCSEGWLSRWLIKTSFQYKIRFCFSSRKQEQLCSFLVLNMLYCLLQFVLPFHDYTFCYSVFWRHVSMTLGFARGHVVRFQSEKPAGIALRSARNEGTRFSVISSSPLC